MKLNMRFTIGVFFTLAIAVSSCDTFKDEITPDNYSEVAKKTLIPQHYSLTLFISA